MTWLSRKRPGLIWSSTAPRWRSEDLQHRPSTAGSTVCGFCRFAHIDGRINSNPAQYVRRPKVHPTERRGLDREELGGFLFTAERFDHVHAALAVLLGLNGLRVSEACDTNVEDMAFERGHRVLRFIGNGKKPALIPLVPMTARAIDLAIGERRDGPILLRNDGQRLDRRTPTAGPAPLANGPQSDRSTRACSGLRSSMAALDAGVPLREVQIAAQHADPRTIMRYDRARVSLDRHAHVVSTFIAGASR
jgi:integrase/recombinase XerD